MRLSVLIAVLFLALSAFPVLAQEAEQGLPPEMTSPAPADSFSNQRPMNFYNGGIRMGTSFCRNATFDCNNIGLSQTEIVVAANQCIKSRFQIQKEIMASWSDAGEFENCVLPVEPSTNERGMGEWAICCIKKDESGQCNLQCTRYIDQKS
jgi:hypothetical protein